MSDETLTQTRQKSREFLGVRETTVLQQHDDVVESIAAKNDQMIGNQTDLVNVVSKQDNKDGKGLQFRLLKFLGRKNRSGKNSEEISIGSSNTVETKTSISNESRIENSSTNNQVVGSSSSKLFRIGSQLKKLMKLKSQREIKTEEEVIVVPHSPTTDSQNLIPVSMISDQIIETQNIIQENSISETTTVVAEESPAITEITDENKSVVSAQSETENSNGAVIIAENPPAILVAAALTAQLGAQAEAQIQTSRRNPPRDGPRTTPFLYLQEEEPRVQTYVQNMIGDERDSIATGSESSSHVSEVVDANEQPEGHDAAEQYYNALLRAVIRKQFRHLDDEPPIY